MTEDKLCQFYAIFPSIQSAIRIDGDGGMRIQLDIPETEMSNALDLLTMRQRVLLVTVQVEEGRSF